jgi:hypothetical protein
LRLQEERNVDDHEDRSAVAPRQVAVVAATGLMPGRFGAELCPNDSVRRDRMAVFLYEAFLVQDACSNGACPQ